MRVFCFGYVNVAKNNEENNWVYVKLICLTVGNQNSDRGIEFNKQIISKIIRSYTGKSSISKSKIERIQFEEPLVKINPDGYVLKIDFKSGGKSD